MRPVFLPSISAAMATSSLPSAPRPRLPGFDAPRGFHQLLLRQPVDPSPVGPSHLEASEASPMLFRNGSTPIGAVAPKRSRRSFDLSPAIPLETKVAEIFLSGQRSSPPSSKFDVCRPYRRDVLASSAKRAVRDIQDIQILLASVAVPNKPDRLPLWRNASRIKSTYADNLRYPSYLSILPVEGTRNNRIPRFCFLQGGGGSVFLALSPGPLPRVGRGGVSWLRLGCICCVFLPLCAGLSPLNPMGSTLG
jgi:hypothetical protein